MRILHTLTLDRVGAAGSFTWVAPVGIGRRFCERRDLGEPGPPCAVGAVGQPYKTVGLITRMGAVLLLAALGASGQWRAAAVGMPPATDRVVLTWDSLGPGTRYYVQTSTDLLTWAVATNTIGTNVSLAFTGDQSRTFRLWVSNAPPPSATLAWDSSAPLDGVAGYFMYQGVATGTYTNRLDVGLATNAVVTNLVAGATYHFAMTAYTSSGLESEFSNEAVWQNPLQLRIQRLP